jgi:hypothetical protein
MNGMKEIDEVAVLKTEIPIWRKYTLTLEEAAEYFRIGQSKLRKIIAENPNADFLLSNGNRTQIKRKLFEKYIDEATCV